MEKREIVEDYEDVTFRKGLHLQRENFKDAKSYNDYDRMCDAIENLKSEIKGLMLKQDHKVDLTRLEKIIIWYRNLETTYTTNTPNGKQVVFPANMHNKVNHNLTVAFEILVEELRMLDLL